MTFFNDCRLFFDEIKSITYFINFKKIQVLVLLPILSWVMLPTQPFILSALSEHMSNEINMDVNEISYGFSMVYILTSVFLTSIGRFIDIKGPRIMIGYMTIPTSVLLSVPFLVSLFGQTIKYWQLIIIFSFVRILTMISHVSLQKILQYWFESKFRGFVFSIYNVSQLCQILSIPLIFGVQNGVSNTKDWKIYLLYFSCFTFILNILGFLLLTDKPSYIHFPSSKSSVLSSIFSSRQEIYKKNAQRIKVTDSDDDLRATVLSLSKEVSVETSFYQCIRSKLFWFYVFRCTWLAVNYYIFMLNPYFLSDVNNVMILGVSQAVFNILLGFCCFASSYYSPHNTVSTSRIGELAIFCAICSHIGQYIISLDFLKELLSININTRIIIEYITYMIYGMSIAMHTIYQQTHFVNLYGHKDQGKILSLVLTFNAFFGGLYALLFGAFVAPHLNMSMKYIHQILGLFFLLPLRVRYSV